MPLAPPLIRTGFTQGVKASSDPSVVPPNALWMALNARLNESGVIRSRTGFVPFGASLGRGHIQGMASAFGDIIAVHGRSILRVNAAGDATVLANNVIGTSASAPVAVLPWATGGDEAAFLFGGDGIWQTLGTEQSTHLVEPYEPDPGEAGNLILGPNGQQDVTSGPARCNIVLLRPALGIRALAAGNPMAPNTVYMSDPGRIDYWPADQWFNLPEGQPRITGLSLWYGAVIVFRDWDIWAYFKRFEGDEGLGAIPQESAIGCAATRSIVPVPGLGIVFLGGPQGTVDNVYTLTHVQAVENQVKAEPIGDDIRNHLVRAIERHGTEGVSAIYHDGLYRLSVPTNTEEQRVFLLDIRNRSGWFIDSAPRTTQFIVHRGDLYGAVWNEGRLVRFSDSLTDEGRTRPFRAAFRREALQPGPARIKRLWLYLAAKGRLTEEPIDWYAGPFAGFEFGAGDQDPGATVIAGTPQDLTATLVIDGNQALEVQNFRAHVSRRPELGLEGFEPVAVLEARFRPSLIGHYVQVRLEGNALGQDYAVIGYGIEYAVRSQIQGRREGVTA